MSTPIRLGIWMDHSEAHLTEFNSDPAPIVIIRNTFSHEAMESAISKSENLMHNKRQQHQTAFYQKLANTILHCTEVLLFGPTDAKTELINVLHADLRFKKIKIESLPTDKMTENQKLAFVKAHFSKK